MKFTKNYFQNVAKIARAINIKEIDNLVFELDKVKKKGGRIFFLGVGGSAGNCSHAVNDFRKLCNIESYTPTDNVSELTARINDEGWASSFVNWLKVSKLKKKDALFILSVGGGNKKKNISTNLVMAIDYAKKINSNIFGIIGKQDGYAKKSSNKVIVIPEVDKKLVTPFSEAFQAVVWHCLVSHPKLQINKTKW
ncbi:SIS domain-containing protein [Candidatus Pelagibacter sp.]|jgi:D-sedoheptulose 7-phosphate isomerase|nr:SIS domain-containing protein [Candidatus Pelagibacter sp.]|tara:strand:+ start:127 stop:711 length:585 start_codon:yes stop_codon:yes gene_type:complete